MAKFPEPPILEPRDIYGNIIPAPKPHPVYTEEWAIKRGYELTRWRNPSKHTVRMIFAVDPPFGVNPMSVPNHLRKIMVVIPPGKEIRLPSLWDQGVVTTHDGRVTGGECPWLEPLEYEQPELEDFHRSGMGEPFNGGNAA